MGGRRGRLVPSSEREYAVKILDEAIADGARQSKACDILDISVRTFQRWKGAPSFDDKRQSNHNTPPNKLTPNERAKVLEIANNSKYCDLPPCQIVPKLADQGIYLASEATFYRVLRQEQQLTHRQRSKPHKHRKPKELVAIEPNQVWCWDISYLPTQVCGMYYYLYFIIDIYSRKIVGYSVELAESSAHASALVREACYLEGVERNQISLHSDNGAPMKGSTLIDTLQQLGIFRSYSRPSVSNDNPYSESLFKTTKYCSLYPGSFSTIEEAREWVNNFVVWYNDAHLHSGLKFVTPNQRHCGHDKEIRVQRQRVYAEAKQRNPERWSRGSRNWDLPDTVVLNPSKQVTIASREVSLAA